MQRRQNFSRYVMEHIVVSFCFLLLDAGFSLRTIFDAVASCHGLGTVCTAHDVVNCGKNQGVSVRVHTVFTV